MFSKETLFPRLRRFVQHQQLIVFIGVMLYAFFAALRINFPFVVMMAMVLSVGNVMYPVNIFLAPLYKRRSFPWNWVVFVPLMFLTGLSKVKV